MRRFFSLLTVMLFSTTISFASVDYNAVLALPQESFNSIADTMTLKELKNIALINKAAKTKVKKYIDYRKGVVSLIQCPVLNKEWVAQYLKTNNFPQAKEYGSHPLRKYRHSGILMSVVNIDGIAWWVDMGVYVYVKTFSLNDNYAIKFEKKNFLSQYNMIETHCEYSLKGVVAIHEDKRHPLLPKIKLIAREAILNLN